MPVQDVSNLFEGDSIAVWAGVGRMAGAVGMRLPVEGTLADRLAASAGGPGQGLGTVPSGIEDFRKIGPVSSAGRLKTQPERGRLNCQGMPPRPRRFSRPPRSDLRARKPAPGLCLSVLTPIVRAYGSVGAMLLAAAWTAGRGEPHDARLPAHHPQHFGGFPFGVVLDPHGQRPLDAPLGPRTYPQWQTMVTTTQRLKRRPLPDVAGDPTPHEDVK